MQYIYKLCFKIHCQRYKCMKLTPHLLAPQVLMQVLFAIVLQFLIGFRKSFRKNRLLIVFKQFFNRNVGTSLQEYLVIGSSSRLFDIFRQFCNSFKAFHRFRQQFWPLSIF